MADETRYIILDEDIGTDDAWALFMLLKAEKTHKLKVLALTCVGGNASVDNVAANTLRVLDVVKRTDVNYLLNIEFYTNENHFKYKPQIIDTDL